MNDSKPRKNTDEIQPGERRELRSVVRSQMKVLRAEVAQRKVTLAAEVEARLVARYEDDDRRADEVTAQARQIVRDANAELESLVRESGLFQTEARDFMLTPRLYRKTDRSRLREAMLAGIEAQSRQALLELDRREADLLRELAVDALKTSAARAFLEKFPTVTELVPSSRLTEIETAFEERQRR